MDSNEPSIKLLSKTIYNLIITGLKIEGKSTIDLLKSIKEVSPDWMAIILM